MLRFGPESMTGVPSAGLPMPPDSQVLNKRANYKHLFHTSLLYKSVVEVYLLHTKAD